MALRDSDDLRDRMEDAASVLAFLRESLCAARELPFSHTALSGAQLIFWELGEELEKIRSRIA